MPQYNLNEVRVNCTRNKNKPIKSEDTDNSMISTLDSLEDYSYKKTNLKRKNLF
jgi:hypothetical protein